MDSINNNQAEETHKHLAGGDAARRIQDMAQDAGSCFFCTNAPDGETQGTRPMSIEKADEAGHLWFLSASDSHKNREIEADPQVRIFLQGAKHSGFLVLESTATIHRDKALIDELWNPVMKTWFTEGKDDPRITVIQVVPASGYYWDNKHGDLVAATKMVVGAAIGKTLDDSIEGQLRP